jgi:hypothetical protein
MNFFLVIAMYFPSTLLKTLRNKEGRAKDSVYEEPKFF